MGKGGFTLPGESGYEELTLKMAEKWGADVIRDSDGTVLSDEITHAGYGIYSTICIIRDHNAWAKENQDKLQQTFLCTPPCVAESDTVAIGLMDSFLRSSSGLMTVWRHWNIGKCTTEQPTLRSTIPTGTMTKRKEV